MGKTAVIVGAGPSGALSAILLAQRGYDVQIFDKRALPDRRPPEDDRKAYLLNLNAGSLRTFKAAKIGLDEIVKTHNGAVEMVFRRPNGGVQHALKMEVSKDDPKMLRVYRDEISRHLIDKAKQLFPDAIKFTFEAALVSVNFDKQLAEFAPKGKVTSEVFYDLLVGADGAGSLVREELQKVLAPGFVTRWSHNIVYTTGPLNSAGTGEFPTHTFMGLQGLWEGAAMVYSRGDGDRRVGLFLSEDGAARVRSGDTRWLTEAVDTKLTKFADSARSSLKELVGANPEFQKMAGWTYLSQLHGPKTVLVGDAAHTMTPILGQGCNSGLEDARILAETLDSLKGDVDAALPAYTTARLPDIRALVELNEIAADERALVQGSNGAYGHKLWVSSHSLLLGLHLRLHFVLNKALPSVFSRPALQRAQMGDLRFRDVRPALYWDLVALTGISVAVAAASLGGLSYLRKQT